MDDVVHKCPDLTEDDIDILERIEPNLALLADLSGADMLIYCSLAEDRAMAIAQARPHSVPPIYDEPLCGKVIVPPEKPAVFDTLETGSSTRGTQGIISEGAPIVQDAEPIYGVDGKVIAALSVEKTMIEKERDRHRPIRFRKALERLQAMVLQGELEGLSTLSPFAEEDGVLLVDHRRRIRYASDIATNLYRRLRYMDTLEKKDLSSLDTSDGALVQKVLQEKRCLEEEAQEGNRIWIRKAIPISICV